MILFIGAGYVGLCNALKRAINGETVTVLDNNKDVIKDLSEGHSRIGGDSLNETLKKCNSITFINKKPVLKYKELCIAVPTPSGIDGKLDMSVVEECIKEYITTLADGGVLTIYSTINPDWRPNLHGRKDLLVVYRPEFLREASCWRDVHEGRGILGVYESNTWKEAAVIKLATNTFLATRLALLNEIARYCDREKISIINVRDGIAKDPRIGRDYFEPRGQYGGACLPKDVKAFAKIIDSKIAKAVDESNND